MSIRTVIAALTVALVSVSLYGQDLLARQAPSDKRLKALDSISLRRYLPGYGSGLMGNSQTLEFAGGQPSSSLYPEWNNNKGRQYNVAKPAEYKVDLRNFCMPCDSRLVTSHYGYRPQFKRFHYGTDIKVYVGDTIRSVFNGKIRIVAYEGKGYGNYVIIRHDNGLETVYGHMSKHLVKENQVVRAGQPIGLGGNTGRSTGPHLHFETRFLGEYINPEHMFSFEARDAKGDCYVYRSNGRGGIIGAPVHSSEPDIMLAGVGLTNGTARGEMAMNVNLGNASTDEKAINAEQERASLEKARKDADKARIEAEKARNKKEEAARKVYRVKQGDTLYAIANKHHTTVAKLCKLNNIKETSTLRLGQLLKCS